MPAEPTALGDQMLGLIVPIDLVAFCVGRVDEKRATPLFAGNMTNYLSQTTTERAAFLGVNVSRSLSADPPLVPLGLGVHLHWALPDALTKAAVIAGQLSFPAVPDRWLVTRYLLAGTNVRARSWVVESDALSTTRGGQQPVTLPVTPTGPTDPDFRYLGRWYDYSQSWRSTPSTIKALTGYPLNAVSNGVVSFAGYHPNSSSVFGFWDRLEDIDGAPVAVMYSVTGWFDDPAEDPLVSGLDLTEVQDRYGWTFDLADARPEYSLYSGLVQAVEWNPDRDYAFRQPLQAPIPASVAVGNNPAEALTAYFKDLDHPDEVLFEPLFNAFQLGLLSMFQEPSPDRLVQLFAALRGEGFATSDAGTMYGIVVADGDDDPSPQDELVDLPLRLAGDLNLLNLYRQQSDLCLRHADVYRQQLFAYWYRIFMASPETRNAAFTAAYYKLFWWDALASVCRSFADRADAQKAVVEAQLGDRLLLQALAAPRYYQGAEPVVLLEGDQLAYPPRYGADAAPGGYLRCQLTDQVVSAVTVDGTTIGADRFPDLVFPIPNGLPHSEVFSSLRVEAALLNTSLAAAITGLDSAALQAALKKLLVGEEQTVYQVAGQPPAPVAVDWWANNPWMPIYLLWSVSFLRVVATGSGAKLVDYRPDFFTAHFDVLADLGGAIAYTGTGDPSQPPPTDPDYPQLYGGAALLQPGPADNLTVQIEQYLVDHPNDPTLVQILAQLKQSNILVQPLSGFNDLLTMYEQAIQLRVKVPPGSTYEELTTAVAQVVGDLNSLGPAFNGSFNPIRAGFMRLSLEVVGVFGDKRVIEYPKLIPTGSMVAHDPSTGAPIPDVAYLEPRVAQPTRLLFRWLSADSTELEEMNAHPATSPICGWLLPDHLHGSFFLYNAQGRALGSLLLDGNRTAVLWQSAPGDNATINQTVEQVLEFENPRLRELALALKSGGPEFFASFWRAIDSGQDSINPQNLEVNANLSVLIGRPVALVQAALRLEVDGTPDINLGWPALAGEFKEKDNNFTGVRFPVILGDVTQLNDGLLGYFKQDQARTGYDFGTFYSEAAPSNALNGVVRPSKTNLALTATPKPDRIVASPTVEPVFTADDLWALNEDAQKVLILMDPRAPVHATPGILPTKAISIPPDVSNEALSAVETSFLVAPALRGGSGLALPLPTEEGFQFSWVEQFEEAGSPRWRVTPEILPTNQAAVWAYTPQRMVEGWLRMNPVLLEFDLLNAAGKPAVVAGTPNSVGLTILNRKPGPITLTPGDLLAEGEPNPGSVIYLHPGALVAQDNVPAIQLVAAGWRFHAFHDPTYGWYWAATPTTAASLARGESLRISVANLIPLVGPTQAQTFFDYYNVTGLNDGVYADLLTVQSPAQATTRPMRG